MNLKDIENQVCEGDLVSVVSKRGKRYVFIAESGQELQTNRGIIHHAEIIGMTWGSRVSSHIGNPFFILPPGITDLVETTKRNTQIMYPKDMGFILLQMNINPGKQVIEAGCGSGSFTQVLATYVGENGHVFSYDEREDILNLARKNLSRQNLSDRVTFIHENISQGFDQENMDAIFLDLPNPHDYLANVSKALKAGGYFGSLLPTTNQVSRLLTAHRRHGFENVETCEILLRYFQSESEKFRPVDRMVAHTGYLIFSRLIV